MPDKVDKLLESNFHFDPCYLPALLKVSTELHGGRDDHLEELLESTLSESNLSDEDLKRYIEDHKQELLEEAKRIEL